MSGTTFHLQPIHIYKFLILSELIQLTVIKTANPHDYKANYAFFNFYRFFKMHISVAVAPVLLPVAVVVLPDGGGGLY